MDKSVNRSSRKLVGQWLMLGVVMLVIQIALGGITRLTGSGLSITKWELVTGTLPPLDNTQWMKEFNNYRQSPQYHLLNYGFSLNEFKSIFFWEWLHRLWGRLIGFVFLIPFIFFIIRGQIKRDMIKSLIVLFLLGALQGAVGWIMVASGLTGNAVYVEPVKLAMHFTLASVLLCYTFWFALKLLYRKGNAVYAKGLGNYTLVLIILVFVQLIFGALMAGNKGASAAPTWPDINGSFIPAYIFSPADGWKSIFENVIVIHAIHRTLAYFILLFVIIWTFQAYPRMSTHFRIVRWFPIILVFIQIILGILTVLTSSQIKIARWNIFEWMAQLHQLVAICLLLSLISCFYFLQTQQKHNYQLSIDPQLI